MEEALDRLTTRPPSLDEAQALWVVGKAVADIFDCAYGAGEKLHCLSGYESLITWFFYKPKESEKPGVAFWVRCLQDTAWLPDEQGNLHQPRELFDPSLKEILGSEGFAFLHPAIPLERYRGWARQLGLRLEATVTDVCQALRARLERGASPEEVRPIYQWLQQQCEKSEEQREELRQKFETEPLILVPDQGVYRRFEVCWEDPRGVLPELHSHWPDLRRLFVEFLQIRERPDINDIAQYLVESLKQKKEPKEWQRAAIEVERQWEKIADSLRNALRRVPWPGERSGHPVWELPQWLYIRDDRERVRLFEGRVAWWKLEDLRELAQKLEVTPISQARPTLHPQGDLGEETYLTGKLGQFWPAIRWMASGRNVLLPESSLVVRKAMRLQVIYRLNWAQSAPVERAAALDQERQTLWVTSEADTWEIGDALEEGLSIRDLREFLKDIWEISGPEEWKRMLTRWQRKLGAETIPDFPEKPITPSEAVTSFPQHEESSTVLEHGPGGLRATKQEAWRTEMRVKRDDDLDIWPRVP